MKVQLRLWQASEITEISYHWHDFYPRLSINPCNITQSHMEDK